MPQNYDRFRWPDAGHALGLEELVEFFRFRYADVDLDPVLAKLWCAFIHELLKLLGEKDKPARVAALFGPLNRLIRASAPRKFRAPGRHVFISHRQGDIGLAKRAACLAKDHGYTYWLDIYDPSLKWLTANRGHVAPALFSVLTAAVIEIALLSSSHILALWSRNAPGSTWIPYEYGRVKDRKFVRSLNACAWVSSQVHAPPAYFYLATFERQEGGVRRWFGTKPRNEPCLRETRSDCLDDA
ncbi:MAG: hypothetical protein AAGE01_14860 [Pseudomonadota bacterium]